MQFNADLWCKLVGTCGPKEHMPYLVLNVAALDFVRSNGLPVRWPHEDTGRRCRLGPKSFRRYVRDLAAGGWLTIESEVHHAEYVVSPSIPPVLSETPTPYWDSDSKQRRKDAKSEARTAKQSTPEAPA